MEVEIKRVDEYVGSGCSCCEPTCLDTYEVWIDGEYVTVFQFLEDALMQVLRMYNPDFKVSYDASSDSTS